MKHVVIIGNGISGITAARHIRKLSGHEITVISTETDYFYSRTALMYIYMGHLKYEHTKPYEDWFWEKNRIALMRAYVKQVDTAGKKLILSDDTAFDYDFLIIATGSTSNLFDWKGHDLKGVQGLYTIQDIELMEENTKDITQAVVVGGGLIGIEIAEMLRSRNIPVTFLVREKNYWNSVLPLEEAQMLNRHILEHGIDLRLQTALKEILPDENGRVKAVLTDKGKKIQCQFVGIAIGVSPNIGFVEDSGIEINRGVLVDEYLETSISGVYALGDCAEHRTPLPNRRQVEPIWYSGRMMGETVAQTICGSKTAYHPGVWFNSAKFFDIEYQTYGWVWSELKENEATFYWEHPDGRKSFRMVYDKNEGNVLGFIVMGMRLRHEVCDRWINEKAQVDHVMEHLPMANFDPEFFKKHEREIIQKYNEQTGKKLMLKSAKALPA